MINGSTADWKLLTDLLQERFGLSYAGGREELLAARLSPRLQELHLDGVRAYYHFLQAHPAREDEFGELARRITNNETYFFRETAHFDAIVGTILPALLPTLQGRPARILSAACSSGEEPYSLNIRIMDAGLELRGLRWEIDACDLSLPRLTMAKTAVYEGFSFRACDEATRQRCFRDVGGKFELRERYRRGVRFFQANLASRALGAGWGAYDIILCRNVLIYFAPDAFDHLIGRFAQLLAPTGILFLGHAESLLDRAHAFEAVEFPHTTGYRRRSPAA